MTNLGIWLIVLGSIMGLLNWASGVTALVKRNNTSFIPFLGGLLCMLGIYLYSGTLFKSFWWVALVIDFTLVPAIFISGYQSIKHEK